MSFIDRFASRTKARRCRVRQSRRGAVVVFLAAMLVVVFAFVALCIDVGWMTTTKSELQNAADASAAAGAAQLMTNHAAYNIPSQRNRDALVTSAKRSASNYGALYGSYNSAGGVNALTILPADIAIGFTDANGAFVANSSRYPNTVQVVARRDDSANSRLALFFAPILGTRDAVLTATASATVYSGLISSFDP